MRYIGESYRYVHDNPARHFSKRLFYFPYPHTENIKHWHVEKVRSVFRYHQFDDILEEYLALKAGFESGGQTEAAIGEAQRRETI